jgi:hypothetical protein
VNNSCGKVGLGAMCSSKDQCQSNYCVDHVCCDGQCDGQCQACNLASFVGSCKSLTSGQPVGGRQLWGGNGACAG